eukprot:380984-Pyramimonas_sp.AAC.1
MGRGSRALLRALVVSSHPREPVVGGQHREGEQHPPPAQRLPLAEHQLLQHPRGEQVGAGGLRRRRDSRARPESSRC